MRRRTVGQGTFNWRRPGLLAGVDEAGRGPLAGPVVAAAVILDARRRVAGIADSKVLAPARRSELALVIRRDSLAFGLGWADPAEIDALNILQATFLAMRRALFALGCAPAHIVVDGDRLPRTDDLPYECSVEAVVGGDATVPEIGAASILAKVARDEFMERLELRYPGYGFAGHKGYPTAAHVEALRRLGPTPVHRRSFGPVQSCLPR
ncbi:MAG TPA: ribonuclease HII [Steroidobacteraceae bacterium]|nr:ribonuclease HII [Steroidobacteraceae bacterium]